MEILYKFIIFTSMAVMQTLAYIELFDIISKQSIINFIIFITILPFMVFITFIYLITIVDEAFEVD